MDIIPQELLDLALTSPHTAAAVEAVRRGAPVAESFGVWYRGLVEGMIATTADLYPHGDVPAWLTLPPWPRGDGVTLTRSQVNAWCFGVRFLDETVAAAIRRRERTASPVVASTVDAPRTTEATYRASRADDAPIPYTAPDSP